MLSVSQEVLRNFCSIETSFLEYSSRQQSAKLMGRLMFSQETERDMITAEHKSAVRSKFVRTEARPAFDPSVDTQN